MACSREEDQRSLVEIIGKRRQGGVSACCVEEEENCLALAVLQVGKVVLWTGVGFLQGVCCTEGRKRLGDKCSDG